MDTINVETLNVRGLGNRLKRKCIFQYLKDKKLDIVLLQETYSSKHNCVQWQNEWGNKWVFSSGTTGSRGVAILINPKFKSIIKLSKVDHDGQFVICTIELENFLEYTICNIYAPNEDSPQFFQSVLKALYKTASANIIMGGDFNLVLHPNVDRLNSLINNCKACEYLKEYLQEFQMYDIWRLRHPEEKWYTWFRRGQRELSASRIDMLFVNAGLAGMVKEVEIESSGQTMHL